MQVIEIIDNLNPRHHLIPTMWSFWYASARQM